MARRSPVAPRGAWPEPHAGGAAGDATVDPGLDIGRGGLQIARLDDAPGETETQRAGDATQDAVRRPDAAAVPDQQERRARRLPCAGQRAGPRIAARRRRSPSTTSISLPGAASSLRT